MTVTLSSPLAETKHRSPSGEFVAQYGLRPESRIRCEKSARATIAA
jgi:hypothetical protein